MSAIRLVDSLESKQWDNLKLLHQMVVENKDTMNLGMAEFHSKRYESLVDGSMRHVACGLLPSDYDFECGSVCCAIGYAAYWGIGDNWDNHLMGHEVFDFQEYSNDAFCSDEYIIVDGRYMLIWDYLFSHHNNNSVEDLIQRLENVINLKA